LGLNQLAIGGDIQSYALSDADFAARYPALQDAYNQWQSNLGQQTGLVSQGAQGQAGIMQGLGNMIAGRQATPTTSDIQNIQNAAATAGGAVQPIMNLGGQQAGAAQPIMNLGALQAGLSAPITGLGAQQAGLAGPLTGMGRQQQRLGQGIAGMGGQVAGMAATPYALGQALLQEPIDPQTQQQMMRAGLGSAAGAFGAASLGQGMAGQAAAARQLGLNTLQYGQAMRGEAMQDIGQAASILGQGGQLQGLGASTIGGGGQTLGLAGGQLAGGGQLYGLGGQQLGAGAQAYGLGAGVLGQGAQTLGLGANTAATAGALSGQAQSAQEQYAMDTANMANIYGNLQNQQAMNLMTNMQTAGNLFQKRPFGMGGTNLAQTELGQAGAYNSFQQANYATMNGIAFNSAQLASQQQQAQAQQGSAMTGAAISAGTTAAVTAATVAGMAACWVARSVFGVDDPRWLYFRSWLFSKRCPIILRKLYLRFGKTIAQKIRNLRTMKSLIRTLMTRIIRDQIVIGYALL